MSAYTAVIGRMLTPEAARALAAAGAGRVLGAEVVDGGGRPTPALRRALRAAKSRPAPQVIVTQTGLWTPEMLNWLES